MIEQLAQKYANVAPDSVPARRAGSAAAFIDAEGCLSIYAALVRRSGLAEDLDQDGPFTVVAPSDQAFLALGRLGLQWLLRDEELLVDVMEFHVLIGEASFDTSARRTSLVRTLQGEAITCASSDGRGFLGQARVLRAVLVSNGAVCISDAVLSPRFGQARGSSRSLRWQRFVTGKC